MIVPLVKMTFCGLLRDKAKILTDLQNFGCLHIIPLRELPEALRSVSPASDSREALRFLQESPQKLRAYQDRKDFDPFQLETQILELKARMQDLQEERDLLLGRLSELQPWGDFAFPDPEDFGGLRLWFYAVPYRLLAHIPPDVVYEVVQRDNRQAYIVVLAAQEPANMPVARVRVGKLSPHEMRRRLEEVEMALEDVQLERTSLTRWRWLLEQSLARLEDETALTHAALVSLTEEPLFALQAWAPAAQQADLLAYAQAKGLVCEVVPPDPQETPPTLLRNHPRIASGQDLVCFYKTPGYWEWDPSAVVLISFSIFFAMIMADAGYALLLAAVLGLSWRRLGASETGRWWRDFAAIVLSFSTLYGILVNSYFGLSFPPGTWPAALHLLDLHDFNLMMGLSVSIGVTHLLLAHACQAYVRRGSLVMLAPLGWIGIFLGAVGYFLGSLGHGPELLLTGGLAFMITGALGVLFFTSGEGTLWQRLLGGLQGLAGAVTGFGDTLSYLRLFALGLASASLADNFNMLAQNAKAAYPALGLLFAALIAILGHGINLLLAIASGFIHGLRLNFIEFFNWSLGEEGIPFHAFRRKEKL